MIHQISVEEYDNLRKEKKDLILIDVRNEWEYKLVHFEEAKLIPLNTLAGSLANLDKTKQYLIYCHHGSRSMQACLFLKMKGFNNVSNLKGGIDAWSNLHSEYKKY